MRCHGCGTAIQIEDKIYRGDTCRTCGRPLHCCKNCSFYDPTAHNQCREPQAELVGDKEAANFCDYFRPARGSAGGISQASESTRKKLEDLFKKKD
ncbi:MAG TPA: hypothetical protein VM123_15735 [archaeon]|nr:hypothetical protein [archaeon]